MTNVCNVAAPGSLYIWMIVGDCQGTQTISWTGGTFDTCFATTLTHASKLSGSWVTGAQNYSNIDISIPCNYRQLAIAFYTADTTSTKTATGSGNTLRYPGSNLSGACITDADTAATNVLTCTGGAGSYDWMAAGVAVDPPMGGSQVVFFG